MISGRYEITRRLVIAGVGQGGDPPLFCRCSEGRKEEGEMSELYKEKEGKEGIVRGNRR